MESIGHMPNLEFSSKSYALLKFSQIPTQVPFVNSMLLPKLSSAKDT